MTAAERIEIPGQEPVIGLLNDNGTDKRLVLIAHGSPGHKDYYFFPLLAERLPYSSFRFDFRGSGESGGEPRYNNMDDNVHDLHTVANYFAAKGYIIFAVIGHSRGAIAALKYAATLRETPLFHVVNIAARYKMGDSTRLKDSAKIALKEKGYFDWPVDKHGVVHSVKVTQQDVDAYAAWDNSHVSRISKGTCVLTCHGLDDTVVTPDNAAMFANRIANHTLELVPGANHTFEGKYEELVAIITAHFESHNNAYERAQVLGHPLSVCIPRWIDVEGVQNFRDIGGWPIKDGSGYVRERTVFRCAHLGGITEKGIQTLRQLRVSSVFDFRSEAEFKNEKFRMPDIPGITHYPSAMFQSEDFSPENMAKNLSAFLEGPQGFLRAYKNILERAKDQYRKIFLHIIERPNTASVVHCQAGKDRTGLFFVLLLGLCGVDDDIIVQEYSLTTLGIWEPRKTLEAKAKAFGVSYEKALEVYGAPVPAMYLTLQHIRDQYGSCEGFIRQECGLSDQQCQALRDTMVVRVPFQERQLYRGIEP